MPTALAVAARKRAEAAVLGEVAAAL